MTGNKVIVYTAPNSIGGMAEQAVKEFDVPHELVVLSFENGDHKGEKYRKVHPFGLVPAMVDGDITLFESGAICLYLQRKYGPELTEAEHAHILQWVLFSFSTLERAFFTGEMDKVIPAVEALLGPLDAVLKGREFLVADQFTVADQAVAGHIGWAAVHMEGVKEAVAKFPECDRYWKAYVARPTTPFHATT